MEVSFVLLFLHYIAVECQKEVLTMLDLFVPLKASGEVRNRVEVCQIFSAGPCQKNSSCIMGFLSVFACKAVTQKRIHIEIFREIAVC